MIWYTFYMISTTVITYALLLSKCSTHTTVLHRPASRPAIPPPARNIATAATARPWQSDSTLQPHRIPQINDRRRLRITRHCSQHAVIDTCHAQRSPLLNFASATSGNVGQHFPTFVRDNGSQIRQAQSNEGHSITLAIAIASLQSDRSLFWALKSVCRPFCSPKCEPLYSRPLPKCNELTHHSHNDSTNHNGAIYADGSASRSHRMLSFPERAQTSSKYCNLLSSHHPLRFSIMPSVTPSKLQPRGTAMSAASNAKTSSPWGTKPVVSAEKKSVNAKEWPALASMAKPGDKKDAPAHGNKPFSSAHLLGKGSRSSKRRLVEPARPRSAS
eukprot:scaffold32434_cov39-Cyclotella_meneghiniana.AAC.3